MRYLEILEELGFSDKESAVYLAILALDSATVADIAEKAQIQRTTCYEILDSLLHRGLVTKYQKHKKIYFSGGDPRRLLAYLDREKEESIKKIDQQKSKVSEVMGEFLSLLEPKSTKPKIALYEGEKGMREAYEDTLTSESEILAYLFTHVTRNFCMSSRCRSLQRLARLDLHWSFTCSELHPWRS